MPTLVVKNLKTFFSLLFISARARRRILARVYILNQMCVVGERGWIKVGGRIIIRRSNENRTYRRIRAETHTKAFRQIIPAVNAWIWYTIHTHTQQYNIYIVDIHGRRYMGYV